jgi:hypothetical protein
MNLLAFDLVELTPCAASLLGCYRGGFGVRLPSGIPGSRDRPGLRPLLSV